MSTVCKTYVRPPTGAKIFFSPSQFRQSLLPGGLDKTARISNWRLTTICLVLRLKNSRSVTSNASVLYRGVVLKYGDSFAVNFLNEDAIHYISPLP